MSDDIVDKAEPLSDDIQLVIDKKPRTDKQKEHLRKMLEAKKAKADARKKGEKESKDEDAKKVETLRSKVTSKNLVTKEDLNKFFDEVKVLINPKTNELKVEPKEAPKPKEEPKPAPAPKPVAPVAPPAPAKKLTGHELLDTLFNLK
jgi:hypothetical protein